MCKDIQAIVDFPLSMLTSYSYQWVNPFFCVSQAKKAKKAGTQISYSLKVMNPDKRTEYTVHKFQAQKFPTVSSARTHVSKFLTNSLTVFGYIIPGHGSKGRMIDLKTNLMVI